MHFLFSVTDYDIFLEIQKRESKNPTLLSVIIFSISNTHPDTWCPIEYRAQTLRLAWSHLEFQSYFWVNYKIHAESVSSSVK